METLLIILLPALGLLMLLLSGVFLEDNLTGSIFLALCGVFMLMLAGGLLSEASCERTLAKYVNGEVTYDTVAVDKDGKLLEVNYPRTKDSWASGFTDDCLQASLTSSLPV